MSDNQTKEADIKTSKQELSKLLSLLDFPKLSVDFMRDVVLANERVREDFDYFKFVADKSLSEAKFQYSKPTGKKVKSFGGTNDCQKVMEVYNNFNNPPAPITESV